MHRHHKARYPSRSVVRCYSRCQDIPRRSGLRAPQRNLGAIRHWCTRQHVCPRSSLQDTGAGRRSIVPGVWKQTTLEAREPAKMLRISAAFFCRVRACAGARAAGPHNLLKHVARLQQGYFMLRHFRERDWAFSVSPTRAGDAPLQGDGPSRAVEVEAAARSEMLSCAHSASGGASEQIAFPFTTERLRITAAPPTWMPGVGGSAAKSFLQTGIVLKRSLSGCRRHAPSLRGLSGKQLKAAGCASRRCHTVPVARFASLCQPSNSHRIRCSPLLLLPQPVAAIAATRFMLQDLLIDAAPRDRKTAILRSLETRFAERHEADGGHHCSFRSYRRLWAELYGGESSTSSVEQLVTHRPPNSWHRAANLGGQPAPAVSVIVARLIVRRRWRSTTSPSAVAFDVGGLWGQARDSSGATVSTVAVRLACRTGVRVLITSRPLAVRTVENAFSDSPRPPQAGLRKQSAQLWQPGAALVARTLAINTCCRVLLQRVRCSQVADIFADCRRLPAAASAAVAVASALLASARAGVCAHICASSGADCTALLAICRNDVHRGLQVSHATVTYNTSVRTPDSNPLRLAHARFAHRALLSTSANRKEVTTIYGPAASHQARGHALVMQHSNFARTRHHNCFSLSRASPAVDSLWRASGSRAQILLGRPWLGMLPVPEASRGGLGGCPAAEACARFGLAASLASLSLRGISQHRNGEGHFRRWRCSHPQSRLNINSGQLRSRHGRPQYEQGDREACRRSSGLPLALVASKAKHRPQLAQLCNSSFPRSLPGQTSRPSRLLQRLRSPPPLLHVWWSCRHQCDCTARATTARSYGLHGGPPGRRSGSKCSSTSSSTCPLQQPLSMLPVNLLMGSRICIFAGSAPVKGLRFGSSGSTMQSQGHHHWPAAGVYLRKETGVSTSRAQWCQIFSTVNQTAILVSYFRALEGRMVPAPTFERQVPHLTQQAPTRTCRLVVPFPQESWKMMRGSRGFASKPISFAVGPKVHGDAVSSPKRLQVAANTASALRPLLCCCAPAAMTPSACTWRAAVGEARAAENNRYGSLASARHLARRSVALVLPHQGFACEPQVPTVEVLLGRRTAADLEEARRLHSVVPARAELKRFCPTRSSPTPHRAVVAVRAALGEVSPLIFPRWRSLSARDRASLLYLVHVPLCSGCFDFPAAPGSTAVATGQRQRHLMFAIHGADGDALGRTWTVIADISANTQVHALVYNSEAFLQDSVTGLADVYGRRVRRKLLSAGETSGVYHVIAMSFGCVLAHEMLRTHRRSESFSLLPATLIFVDMQVLHKPPGMSGEIMSSELLLQSPGPSDRSVNTEVSLGPVPIHDHRGSGVTVAAPSLWKSIARRRGMSLAAWHDMSALMATNMDRLMCLGHFHSTKGVCRTKALLLIAEDTPGFHNGIEVNSKFCLSQSTQRVKGAHSSVVGDTSTMHAFTRFITSSAAAAAAAAGREGLTFAGHVAHLGSSKPRRSVLRLGGMLGRSTAQLVR